MRRRRRRGTRSAPALRVLPTAARVMAAWCATVSRAMPCAGVLVVRFVARGRWILSGSSCGDSAMYSLKRLPCAIYMSRVSWTLNMPELVQCVHCLALDCYHSDRPSQTVEQGPSTDVFEHVLCSAAGSAVTRGRATAATAHSRLSLLGPTTRTAVGPTAVRLLGCGTW
jgi:hypothetical protein